jgi:hypothetical protein
LEAVLLDVAKLTTSETLFGGVLGDGGGNGIGGAGMVGIGSCGKDVVMVGTVILGKVGLNVLGGSLEEINLVHKFFTLLLAKSIGAVPVVILICTVTHAIIEVGEAGGVTPRIWLGVEGRMGVGALKREHGANKGVSGNGLGGKLVKYLVIVAK